MSYPAYGQSWDSTEEVLTGVTLDRASNGVPKVRSFFTADKKVFNLVHPVCTNSEKTTLVAFYASNKLTSFTFVWAADGATYTVIFGEGGPRYTPLPGNRWRIETQLVQV